MTILRMVAVVLGGALSLSAQQTFGKVEIRTEFGSPADGSNGQLLVEADRIQFTNKNRTQLFSISIPTKAVNEISYVQAPGNWSAGWSFRERVHYMTIRFNNGSDLAGELEFKLHKSNYREVLQSVESVTEAMTIYEQEGIEHSKIKHSKPTVASSRADGARPVVRCLISSDPARAQIRIDGALVGTTPHVLSLPLGEHRIALHRKGLNDWKRKITLETGDKLEVAAKLQPASGQGFFFPP